jgi:hypothetical protein
MLAGTADVSALAADAPTVSALASAPLACRKAELLQVTYELRSAARDVILPPALHPVSPPIVTWTFLRAFESDVGPFTMAQTRVLCRSGVRSRGFHIMAFVDSAEAADALRSRWGYRIGLAEVSLERRHHRSAGVVVSGGRTVLDVALLAPQPLSGDDVRFTDTMHLAHTPVGLRLVQVEQTFRFHQAERGRAAFGSIDAAAWGDDRLVPTCPVSAASASAAVTIEPVRFVCRADVSALTGTERVVHDPALSGGDRASAEGMSER